MIEVWQCPRASCQTVWSCDVRTTQLNDFPHVWTAVVVPVCTYGHEGVAMDCVLQHQSLWEEAA